MRVPLSLILILTVGCNFIYAQLQYNEATIFVQDTSKKTNYYIVQPPEKKSNTSSSQNSRVIVRLKSDPLIKASKSSRSARIQSLVAEHEQFKSDIAQSGKRSANARTSGSAKIIFEYSEVFNGFSVEASPEIIEEIKNFSYVSAVLEDKTVKAYDIVSSTIINAPQVWNNLGVTGKGIRIGIIDTGIDYNHPDLGGGIGPNFKVKGGYDFVNNDTDPMDDNGHGTHVAGIAAANGSGLKGVAPDAILYAYKVLGREGSGIDSWILAAIERCVDPDQNPNTDDALDVVNMSLGRPADSSEPISEAVNNAVSKGVIFVVAAGNDYNFGSVGTPGIAEQAITVAATDQYDWTADFSSKGPTPEDYRAKPDIAAPGVDIYSSFLNNSYKQLSGTSMASPHVAGAVALILEKHPDWSADAVKSAIMQSAKPTEENLFKQGTGRIDVFKAINQELIITPGSISLGLLDTSTPLKTYSVPLQIKNLSNTQKNVNLSLENFAPGISASLSSTNFSLVANTTKSITLTVTINTSSLPFKNYPDAYFGSLTANDGLATTKVPVTLLNPSITKLVFTGELPQSTFQVGIDSYYFNHNFPSSSELNLLLPPGKYDLISIYGNRIVVKENINGELNNTITIDKSHAKNIVSFKPKNRQGHPLPYDGNTLGSVSFTGSSRNFICFFPYVEDTVYVSDQSSYYLNMRVRDRVVSELDAFYDINITTPQGFSSSRTYTNNPGDFVKVDVLNPSIPVGSNQDLIYHSQGVVFGLINSYPLSVPNPLKIYYSKRDKEITSYTFLQLNPQSGQSGYAWEAGGFNVCTNDSIYFFDNQRLPLASARINSNEFKYNLGESLVRLNARTYNKENKILLHDFPARGSFNRYYGEREKGTIFYDVKQNNIIVESGSFANKTTDDYSGAYNIQLDASASFYSISLRYDDNFVKGKLGSAKAELKFDMGATDKNPPTLQYLSLEANKVETNNLQEGQQGKIKFGINDLCLSYSGMECYDTNYGLQNIEIKIKHENSNEWISLAYTEITSQWTAYKGFESNLPTDILQAGYYDLSISASDLQNNSIEYQLFPAFLIGPGGNDVLTQVSLIEPKQNAYATGVTPFFKWSSIPNAKSYTIQISENNSFDTPLEFSSTTESYQLATNLNDNKFYYWRVKASLKDNSATAWSSIGIFYTGNPFQAAVPVSPQNQAIDMPSAIQFRWKRAKGQEPYAKFELSTSPDFTYYNYFDYTSDSSLNVSINIYPNSQYYWRITTTHYFDNRYYEVVSPVFTFFTHTAPGVTLIEPLNGAYATGTSPYFMWSSAPGVSHYRFQISDDGFNSILSEQIVYSNATQLPFKLDNNKFYYWRVGEVRGESITWSETRNLYPGDPFQSITLLQPLNQSANQPLSAAFKWKKSFTNTNYKFQLSDQFDFSTLRHEAFISDTTIVIKNLEPTHQYYWRVIHQRTFNESSFTVTSPIYSFTTTSVTDAEDPFRERNFVAYPNPFATEVTIEFYTQKPGNISLSIIDSFGKEVKRFSQYIQTPGSNIITWNGSNQNGEPLSSGVYFVILHTGTTVDQIKIVLTK